MADIGRWFGMDQLSEAYSSFSPYAYVGNNPVIRTDPDGRKWINNDNVTLDPEYIGVASGGGGGFASYFAGGGNGFSSQMNAYFGNTGSGWGTGGSFGGGGGGYATFGQTPAYSAAMNWLNNPDSKGDSFSIVSQKGGYLRYWTNMPETGMAGDIQGLDGHSLKINETDWYGPAGKGNFGFGTAATTIGFVQGSFRLTNGAYNGSAWSPKYYPSAWTGGSRARISTYNFSKIGRGLGRASVVGGAVMDGIAVRNYYKNPNSTNAVHPNKAILNTVMGVIGSEGGTYGAIISTFYFGIDNFYPGGWGGNAEHPGVFNDQSRLNQENSFNPYWQLYPGAMKQ